jgi:hypothetical protein
LSLRAFRNNEVPSAIDCTDWCKSLHRRLWPPVMDKKTDGFEFGDTALILLIKVDLEIGLEGASSR